MSQLPFTEMATDAQEREMPLQQKDTGITSTGIADLAPEV